MKPEAQAEIAGEKLPLWRLIAAILVLAGMAGVLIALAPVYYEDYQLRHYLGSMVQADVASASSDDAVRAEVVNRARQLELPLAPDDVKISHPNGKLKVEAQCKVQMDFPIYQVDLHFHPSATSH